MKDELEDKLVRAFPNLYRDRHGDMQSTAMCWGFECGDGWFNLLWKLSEKLEKMILELKAQTWEDGDPYDYPAASQVKEKYGTLRFYMTSSTDEMEAAIDEAENESAVTCENCGDPGICNDGGWLSVSCKEHWRGEGEYNYEETLKRRNTPKDDKDSGND